MTALLEMVTAPLPVPVPFVFVLLTRRTPAVTAVPPE
jgi:hypothetical protein